VPGKQNYCLAATGGAVARPDNSRFLYTALS
jgi:hypothetical protein